jgi:hypothetical protein
MSAIALEPPMDLLKVTPLVAESVPELDSSMASALAVVSESNSVNALAHWLAVALAQWSEPLSAHQLAVALAQQKDFSTESSSVAASVLCLAISLEVASALLRCSTSPMLSNATQTYAPDTAIYLMRNIPRSDR